MHSITAKNKAAQQWLGNITHFSSFDQISVLFVHVTVFFPVTIAIGIALEEGIIGLTTHLLIPL